MKLLRLFNSRINNKLILLSVIPVTVVTAIITWHTIDTRRTEIEANQLTTATQLANSLARISDFALYTARQDILGPLADYAGEIPSVAGIAFLSPDRTPLLPDMLPGPVTAAMLKDGDYAALGDNYFVVEQPVFLPEVEVADYAAAGDADPPASVLLGWVVVVSDSSAAAAKSRDILISHLLISFSVLMGAILLTYALSNHVVSPIKAMTAMVRELERGNLSARITPTTGDELAILANGINHLAKAVAEGRDNLENKVEHATQRLTRTLDDLQRKNRELEVSRTDAEAASVAKGDFLAQMSHELRTPITAIQGFVKLLDSSELSSPQQRYCTIIQQASVQLLQLIDDILDITRLQSNVLVLDRSAFSLAECIETPLSLMAPTAHDKGVELILDITPTVPYQLVGDSLRIRQIIYNLISNAIKFTPAGYVRLKVDAITDQDAITLKIEVSDTGIGIPDKQQARLFEPFSQADNSISRRFGGSGLGLSIVKRLVDLMAGELHLESTTGKGSTFFISLPLALQPGASSRQPLKQYCALLFDSHPQSRQALEHRLARYVDTIESCEDFADLEISAPIRQPDIIIYSAPLSIGLQQLAEDLSRLETIQPRHIVVLAPTTVSTRSLESLDALPRRAISFLDKPPLSADLEVLFSGDTEPAPDTPNATTRPLNARLLAAEDNEFTRILLMAFFEGSDCQLSLVGNGREAIAACAREHFDLVLMDVHMPEVNGISALKAIRGGNGPNSTTPIIMLTADILQQEENALFDAGASDLVFKPFDQEKLLAAIHKHLKARVVPPNHRDHNPSDPRHKQLFAEEVLRLARLAKGSLENRDETTLRDAIHQLLGIAGVYHMTYLERAVQALHQAIKSGNGNKMFAAMETLELEVAKLVPGGLE